MTATNHALTGAIIGLSVANPLLAGVAALASHFVCDAIPHFGREDSFIKTKMFRDYLILDGLLCILLVLVLFAVQPKAWLLAALCAFLATSPDLFWLPKYLNRNKQVKPRQNWFTKFASNIQWYQKPDGAYIEFIWLLGCVAILTSLLAK